MKERIKEIIAKENKKIPLTDEQIAKKLGIRRDEVTLLRHELQIPDSRKRRHPLLEQEIAQILQKSPDISNRSLTMLLQERGFDVSRFIVHQLRGKMQALSPDAAGLSARPRPPAKKTESSVSFHSLIGAKGTLKAAIQQAQAAVLYPPHGLHTLFFGATGVGKSRMAEAMYHFAVEQNVMKKNAPFVVFNCADYAKNPQLLLSQLFGYVKGAFTGAVSDREGLVDQANGGILFLDEIHRLPPEGQENLFYLIDKGVYRRLGEVAFHRKATILIVGATTESPESSLLLTLRRRIPMTIELPSLADWTERERLSLIFHFFNEETERIGKEVIVQKDVIAALLSYECPGNTGQLHSDIRVLMAKAFLKNINQDEQGAVLIDRQDLPVHVASLRGGGTTQGWTMLKKEQYRFIPGQRSVLLEVEEAEPSGDHLYEWVMERYQNLKNQGQSKELIQLIVNKELESRLEPFGGDQEEKVHARLRQLVKLAGEQVVQTVEQMLWIAERHLALDYQRISFVLAIHLRGLLDRWPDSLAAESEAVIDDDSIEFKVAEEMAKVVQTRWGVPLPRQEVALLATYLNQCSVLMESKPLIGVVAASYGQIARSMVDVASRLFEKRHAHAVELYWNDEIPQAIERIGSAIRQADQGEGVILLADMGCQFLTDAEWEEKTGRRVRVLSPVTTTLLVEVLRKCLYSSETLDQLVGNLHMLPAARVSGVPAFHAKPIAIVTICLTGDGAARRLNQLLKEKLGAGEVQPVIISASSLSIRKQYKDWLDRYHICAVVGTVDPMLEGVPFVSVQEIADESGISFLKRLLLLASGSAAGRAENQSYRLRDLIYPQLIAASFAVGNKADVIEHLAGLLGDNGFVASDFLQHVWERERMGHTFLMGAAIPHADTRATIKPAIAIAELAEPVEWEPGAWVRHVFMLAITEHCQPAVEELYHALQQQETAGEPLDLQQFLQRIPNLEERSPWKNK
ncbi:sigma 54-interacting transcriptional regulator [Brevibacillus sp. WF146]|uniref:sigma 54-interacting transcriptional regulator n=1 Tax=Brevibacillus sp. WF146 TaxID=319501 RepID=UPI0007ECD213|nr:sigma 54-interacting transcriptional regulator [Brevibacillus sp. WF146]UYZ12263.1 sigma 54-interacting transcriptional regulator [Brevibacillus sp. WF146]